MNDLTLPSGAQNVLTHDHTLGRSNVCRKKERTQALPKARWDHFRPTIESLYVEDEFTLHEIREVMKREHNFDAT